MPQGEGSNKSVAITAVIMAVVIIGGGVVLTVLYAVNLFRDAAPLLFGVVVGWVTYRTLRRDGSNASAAISDIASVISAIGGTAATGIVARSIPSSDQIATSHAIGWYLIGLFFGFFLFYLINLIVGDTETELKIGKNVGVDTGQQQPKPPPNPTQPSLPKVGLKQFRDSELALWQSAVDQYVAKQKGTPRTLSADSGNTTGGRPGLENEMVRAAAAVGVAIESPNSKEIPLLGGAEHLGHLAAYCAAAAFKWARAKVSGNAKDEKSYREELGQFTDCDVLGWSECVETYVELLFKAHHKIPYRTPQAKPSSEYTRGRWIPIPHFLQRNVDKVDNTFVIDGLLPNKARIALLGDWGTGLPQARKLLEKLNDKYPNVVIHLGDIYYSGTENEVKNYFYDIWQKVLHIRKVPWGGKLSKADLNHGPATFTLSGNHDMYSGGEPYYKLIDMLGQPASCFCLRNDYWQFVAVDTGYNDSDPFLHTTTKLQDPEVAWLKERINEADKRKTVLLSHHQLFSKHEKIAGSTFNQPLLEQVKDILPNVTVWFWGHEHNLVVYKRYAVADGIEVLARCIGHGAYPIGVDETTENFPEVPTEDVKLDPDKTGGLLQHGYVMLELDGPMAYATYYEYDPTEDIEKPIYQEVLPRA